MKNIPKCDWIRFRFARNINCVLNESVALRQFKESIDVQGAFSVAAGII